MGGVGTAPPGFGWGTDRLTDLEHRVQRLERQVGRLSGFEPIYSATFVQCGTCGMFTAADAACVRGDCPRRPLPMGGYHTFTADPPPADPVVVVETGPHDEAS